MTEQCEHCKRKINLDIEKENKTYSIEEEGEEFVTRRYYECYPSCDQYCNPHKYESLTHKEVIGCNRCGAYFDPDYLINELNLTTNLLKI